MYRKILDALTILSTILVLGILGGGFFTFKYVTSEQFKAKMMNQVLENVQGLMGDVLGNSLPSTTGNQFQHYQSYLLKNELLALQVRIDLGW